MVLRTRAALLTLFVLPICAGAQTLVSPNDPIYGHLRLWEQRGVIDWLPPLRPLPAPIVRSALRQAAVSEHPTDRQIAKRLLTRYFGPLPVQGQAQVVRRSKAAVADDGPASGTLPAQLVVQLETGIEMQISNQIGFELAAHTLATSIAPTSVAPELTDDPYERDAPRDNTTILNEAFDVQVELAGNIFVGPPELGTGPDTWYVQAGFGRSSFGYSEDSPVVSSAAAPAGYLIGTYRGSWIAYSAMFLDLIAKYGICSAATKEQGFCDAEGDRYSLRTRARTDHGFHPTKYLVTQSLSFYPADWLELTALQSVIFGGRLSLPYLLPVFPSLYTQMQLDDYDNAFVGTAARIRLPYGAQASAMVYVDDVNMTKLRRFDFDSDQNKMAVELVASIAPPLPILTVLSARYRMVTPYMYAHHPSALDYLQYTNDGHHLGPLLHPNSDEVFVQAQMFPLEWLGLDLSLRRVRHGGPGGGSVWDHGLIDGTFVFTGPSTFLKQGVLEHLLQARAGVKANIDLELVELSVALAYTYEQVINRNFVRGADEQAHLIELSTAVRY